MDTVRTETVDSIRGKYGDFIERAAANVATPDDRNEVVAIGTACFDSVCNKAADAKNLLVQRVASLYGSNLWLLPTRERTPYPDAPMLAVATMLQVEKTTGRRCEWLFWLDDDVVIGHDAFELLRESANAETRPFVAAPGYDRMHPFRPAVWDMRGCRWEDIPCDARLHQVAATGLPCAIFHRSLFDRVPQPWFAIGARTVDEGNPQSGYKPDTWWCSRLREQNIPVFVNTGVETTHLSSRTPVNRHTAPILRSCEFFATQGMEEKGRGIGMQKIEFPQSEKRLILGLGTGRCGTSLLAHILTDQGDTNATHEQSPYLSWTKAPIPARVTKLLGRSDDSVQADVAWFYLPYVEQILSMRPETRFICMERDRDSYVESAAKKMKVVFQGGSIGGGWERLWPDYMDVTPEALGRYWDEYKAAADALQEKYPGRFLKVDMDALNDRDATEALLRWCGYSEPVLDSVGKRYNVGPQPDSVENREKIHATPI